jgi:hypothetical protein
VIPFRHMDAIWHVCLVKIDDRAIDLTDYRPLSLRGYATVQSFREIAARMPRRPKRGPIDSDPGGYQ